jgi:hypothetical protein
VRIITKKDAGKQVQVKLHEFFGVEVEASNPKNEYLAVPSFIQQQNYTIIKEYNYATLKNKSGIQSIGKRIYLLMATKVSKVDLSWYNLATAEEELYFMLNVSNSDEMNSIFEDGHAVSDGNMQTQPNSSSQSDIIFNG